MTEQRNSDLRTNAVINFFLLFLVIVTIPTTALYLTYYSKQKELIAIGNKPNKDMIIYSKLELPQFQKSLGAFYSGIKTDNPYALLSVPLFFLRRLLLVVLLVFVNHFYL